MLSDAKIKAAMKAAPTSGKKTSIELKDPGERGAGRLMLLIRVMRHGVVTEWYAVYYRASRRSMLKIGTYPTMSLADARKEFREKYAPAISSGADPASEHMRRRHQRGGKSATVGELFQAYVANLKANGKRSASVVERVLLSERYLLRERRGQTARRVPIGAARAIGPDRLAASITPDDITAHLAAIHEHGSVVMAAQTRNYISAAFNWGRKGKCNYTTQSTATDWGILVNPVEGIQVDATAQRTVDRFLSPTVFKMLWDWTKAYNGWGATMGPIQLLMLTGQRVEEVLRISTEVYDKTTRMLGWDKTKNSLPHAVPITPLAASVLDALIPNHHGMYFPGKLNPTGPMHHATVLLSIHQFAKETGVAHFTPRDLRRTFKTLAGDAGVSKDMRDRLQNHVKRGDVSTRHYDRYDYLHEKREAVTKWAEYVDLVLAGKITAIGERSKVVPFKVADRELISPAATGLDTTEQAESRRPA